MMKNTKKVFSLLLSAAMVLGMSVSSFADSGLTIGSSNENTVEEGLFIASNPVPEKAAEYAIKIFESLTPEDMSILRIGQNMDAIRLAHGFTVENTEIPQYYFPVLEDNTVVGILMVNDHADSYGFQLGTSDFQKTLIYWKQTHRIPHKLLLLKMLIIPWIKRSRSFENLARNFFGNLRG